MDLENKILLWTGLGHFCNHIGNYLTAALLIYLQTDIPLTHTEEGLLGSIPMLLLVILSTGVGRIGDKYPYSKKHLIWIGIIGLGIFSVLMSFAMTFTDLALATIVLGISLSTYHPVAFAFLNNMKNQDRNMGINSVFGNSGSAITPLLAMLFTVLTNWRTAFLLFAGIQLVTGLLLWIFFPNSPELHNGLMNTKNNEIKKEGELKRNVLLLAFLLVLISAARAPVFRCISYFTTIVFSDAFAFTRIESSILTAIILGIGASATFLMGQVNNWRISKGVSRDLRINFRINSMLLSNGVATVLLLVLALIPYTLTFLVLGVYLVLAFFFFLGAAILPTIMSEISPRDMGSAFGILFSGATLTGAIAPTVFGYLADIYNFGTSFLFLGLVALLCLVFI
ncbi:MAG: MFS transporter, partial [Candidatus Hodarchaeales archaeon]